MDNYGWGIPTRAQYKELIELQLWTIPITWNGEKRGSVTRHQGFWKVALITTPVFRPNSAKVLLEKAYGCQYREDHIIIGKVNKYKAKNYRRWTAKILKALDTLEERNPRDDTSSGSE